MNHCKVPVIFAYAFSIYAGASILYMIITRSYGTPFKDSLTSEQLIIKESSSKKRMHAFLTSILIMIIAMFVFRPFKQCYADK